MITLGPFIIPSTHPDTSDGNFVHTGFSMEMLCDGLMFQLPIYKDATHMHGQYVSFDDFYFPEPQNGWPVDFIYRWLHDKPTSDGQFVAVSPLLVEIYRQLLPATPMEEFLRDFRTAIHVAKNNSSRGDSVNPDEVKLIEELADSGFVVMSASAFGVKLSVDIAWAFHDEYDGWKNITAGFIEFRPRCGKLNDGKWIGKRWNECIEHHYFKRLAAIAPSKPIECLRGPDDIEHLLEHFEWTITTRHSEADLRGMRIESIRGARHLWSDPKRLAELLKQEGLYSRTTSPSQILKVLPPLMEVARNFPAFRK